MAVTPGAYASPENYRSIIGRQGDGEDGAIAEALAAVSRLIDGQADRFFGRDDDAVQRTYRIKHRSPVLLVDDLSAAPDSIEVDGDPLDEQDYDLEPAGALQGPEPRPFTRVRLRKGAFGEGQRVTITARFGWPDVPRAIFMATIQLAAILRLETPRATRRIPELGDAIEASPEAQNILRQLVDPYRRTRFV